MEEIQLILDDTRERMEKISAVSCIRIKEDKGRKSITKHVRWDIS